jgi:hypothetical protein
MSLGAVTGRHEFKALEALVVVSELPADQLRWDADSIELTPRPERMVFAVSAPVSLEFGRRRPETLFSHLLRMGSVFASEEPIADVIKGVY